MTEWIKDRKIIFDSLSVGDEVFLILDSDIYSRNIAKISPGNMYSSLVETDYPVGGTNVFKGYMVNTFLFITRKEASDCLIGRISKNIIMYEDMLDDHKDCIEACEDNIKRCAEELVRVKTSATLAGE